MAKVKVKYLVEFTMVQTIDWPDDEMEDFNHDNLVCNCDPDEAHIKNLDYKLLEVSVNGKPHQF